MYGVTWASWNCIKSEKGVHIALYGLLCHWNLRHSATIVVTGDLANWHDDNLWCRQWRQGVSNHSLMIVYSSVYSGADQRKHQSSASLAFVRGINRWPVNSPHKGPVMRKMFPFDDVIMVARSWLKQDLRKTLIWRISRKRAPEWSLAWRRSTSRTCLFVGAQTPSRPNISNHHACLNCVNQIINEFKFWYHFLPMAQCKTLIYPVLMHERYHDFPSAIETTLKTMGGKCIRSIHQEWIWSQIAKFMGPTWVPPGSCRPQMGPMLAPWTLLSGFISTQSTEKLI